MLTYLRDRTLGPKLVQFDHYRHAMRTGGLTAVATPLLIAFLLFQRQFVQSFMRAGIK